MIQFFFRLMLSQDALDAVPRGGDPLSHPAIAAMKERQIADLPFDPTEISEPQGPGKTASHPNPR